MGQSGGPWTCFMDMHSGGGRKEKWAYIYIEAPEAEARVIFYNRFGHSPSRVTCTCCGQDYSISEEPTLRRATAYERGCEALQTPRDPETQRYKRPDDPWFDEHYYLEPDEHAEAKRRGYEISDFSWPREHKTVEEYIAQSDVLVIAADEIKPEEHAGSGSIDRSLSGELDSS